METDATLSQRATVISGWPVDVGVERIREEARAMYVGTRTVAGIP